MKSHIITAMVAAGAFCCSCTSSDAPTYEQKILQVRLEKNEEFRKFDSPLRKRDRNDFHGLPYFDVDPAYNVDAEFQRLEMPDTVIFRTSSGRKRKVLKVGAFNFQLMGKSHRLWAYTSTKADADYLFVPFTDETTGDESYGGGRYLDLETNAKDQYNLDFNLAYSPLCSYGTGRYNCAIPPSENHLDVAVQAGERVWEKH